MKSKKQIKRQKRGHDCLDCCSMKEWDNAYKKISKKGKNAIIRSK